MQMKSTKRALLLSVLSLVLCFSMLIGTTFAWFTDSVTSSNNVIVAGDLDVELYYQNDTTSDWVKVDGNTNVFKNNTLWEPGHTEVIKLKVVNEGTLGLKYRLGVNIASEIGGVNVDGQDFELSDYIMFGLTTDPITDRASAIAAVKNSAVTIKGGLSSTGELVAAAPNTESANEVTMVVYMPEEVGNEANYRGAVIPQINLGITLVATQLSAELDSFDEKYDEGATLPDISLGVLNGNDITLTSGNVSVTIPKEAGNGAYELIVAQDGPTNNADGETNVSYDIVLKKDGAVVEKQVGINYSVDIKVGSELQISKVMYNGADLTQYTYDPAGDTLSFNTDSVGPFSIDYVVVPAGAHKLVANGTTKYFLSLNEAIDALEAANNGVLTLGSNVALTETLSFDGDVTATIDMAGYTVSGPITTLLKITDGNLTIKNGAFYNVHAAATETKYSIYMKGDAVAEIKDVTVTTSGVGISLNENAKITELNATISSFINANCNCSYDAISLLGNARIDKITGGTYKSYYAPEYIEEWNKTHSSSGIASWTVNLNEPNTSIGEISGGTFLGTTGRDNSGTTIYVNNGRIETISGGYFGFCENGVAQSPDKLIYSRSDSTSSIGKITGGTFVKGEFWGFGCDFNGIVDASGCKAVETGEKVVVNIQYTTKVTPYTLTVYEVVSK